jgi:hypothetical protein
MSTDSIKFLEKNACHLFWGSGHFCHFNWHQTIFFNVACCKDIYMSLIYRNYMRNLRNAFQIEPSIPIPISSVSSVPQTTIDTSAMLAIEKTFAMRYKIINAIINRNRL